MKAFVFKTFQKTKNKIKEFNLVEQCTLLNFNSLITSNQKNIKFSKI